MLLTPAFALSFNLSYGEPDEVPPAWLSQVQDPLTDAGLLVAGSTSSYDRYGLLYLAASALAVAGLTGLLRQQWSEFTPRARRARAVLVTGLGLVELGWAHSAWALCSEGWRWSGTSHPDLGWGSPAVRCFWGLRD